MRFSRPGRLWIPEAPNLIINRTRELEVVSPVMMYEGWFDVKLIHAATGKVKKHLRFRNLITNAALDAMGGTLNPTNMTAYFGVGTGATAPANADTTLQTPLGTRVASSTLSSGSGPSYAYWFKKLQFTFLEANANGTLTEIGGFSANAGGTMWTRQLFKDGSGTPTAITKTSSDQLQVTYEMRLYSPTADVTGTLVINSTNYPYTIRAADITSATRWGDSGPLANFNAGSTASTAQAIETNTLGTTSGVPGGAVTNSTSGAFSAYVAGSYTRDVTYIWDPGVANYATGIGSLLYGAPNNVCNPPFQIGFTTKIPKDATKRFTLVARLAWGRYP